MTLADTLENRLKDCGIWPSDARQIVYRCRRYLSQENLDSPATGSYARHLLRAFWPTVKAVAVEYVKERTTNPHSVILERLERIYLL